MPLIAHVTYLVREYDEAIRFFVEQLDFELIDDTMLSETKRWVLVKPRGGGDGTALLLARAANIEQVARVGDQTGGRVFLFLQTEDFQRDYEGMRSRGVKFVDGPRSEAYGMVAVFEDLYGNRWDLLGPRAV